MTFLRNVIPLYPFGLSMIFSENRYPLFRIMLLERGIDRFVIFLFESPDQFSRRHHLGDAADALSGAPDFLPGLWLGALARRVGTEAHFRGIGGREIIGIHAGRDDRRLQIIAVYAGEQVGIDDVFRSRRRDHLLVALDRIGFGGGDEGGADIGKVGAEYARGADGAA